MFTFPDLAYKNKWKFWRWVENSYLCMENFFPTFLLGNQWGLFCWCLLQWVKKL